MPAEWPGYLLRDTRNKASFVDLGRLDSPLRWLGTGRVQARPGPSQFFFPPSLAAGGERQRSAQRTAHAQKRDIRAQVPEPSQPARLSDLPIKTAIHNHPTITAKADIYQLVFLPSHHAMNTTDPRVLEDLILDDLEEDMIDAYILTVLWTMANNNGDGSNDDVRGIPDWPSL